VWWVPGVYLGSMILVGLGAAVGRRFHRPSMPQRNWYGTFTKCVVAAAFLLLISGGIVTGWEAGLAVDDWPTSFGHNMLLYPLTLMTAEEARDKGVHYEHAHRLYGMLVGLSTVTLAVTIWFADRRNWLRWLCVVALIIVVVQGVLGGTRVTERNIGLAFVHGVFAQVVFATLVAIAAFTSATWRRDVRALAHPSVGTDRMLSVLLVLLILIQLCLGAGYRHLGSQPEMPEGMKSGLLHGHVTVGVILAAAAIFVGVRAWGLYRESRTVSRLGKALIAAISRQVALGLAAFVAVLAGAPDDPPTRSEVIVTTTHQAFGAVVLSVAVLLVVWSRRVIAPVET
jgi:cytochrome c oxidase assembly protein subunit 15